MHIQTVTNLTDSTTFAQTIGMSSISTKHYEAFKSIVGEAYIFTDQESLEKYGRDETEHLLYLPQVVLRPGTAEEISAILTICNAEGIPVTPRGGGT